MKEGWKYERLDNCCEIKDYLRKPITKSKREPGEIPYYGATGLLDYVKDYIFDEDLVLLGEDGAKWGAGEPSAYQISGKTWVNNHAHALKPIRTKLLDKWLVLYLNYSDLSDFITGVTVPKLNQEKMSSILIPVIPLSEQQQIVDLLDAEFAKIDELKNQAEQSLQNAKELFQSALKEMLTPKEGWKMVTLPEISDNLDSKRIPVTKGKRDEGKYPYYGASGIVDYVGDYIFDEDLLLISEDGANLLAGTYPIAFSVSGKIWVNNHAHVLKFSDLTTQRFVEYYFASIDISDYVTGAAQPKFAQKKMNILPIPYPSIEEQKVVVETLELIEKKIQQLQSNYTRTIQLCADLKQALLRQVFE